MLYIDGFRNAQGVGTDIYRKSAKVEISIILQNYDTVFQAEIWAIQECPHLWMTSAYVNGHIIGKTT